MHIVSELGATTFRSICFVCSIASMYYSFKTNYHNITTSFHLEKNKHNLSKNKI